MSAGRLTKAGRRAALVAVCCMCLSLAGACSAGPGVRLVVLIAVDQLRPDRLDPSLPGGLGRLMREGRVFSEAALQHAYTATCPGHATMLTGRHPGPIGVPGNRFIDPASGVTVYCVTDDPASAGVLGVPPEAAYGRSPRLMRATTLGDWMKAEHSASRVYTVSAKDRSAVTLGGQRPDGAFWIDLEHSLGFTTSRYYMAALPPWMKAGRDFEVFEGLPARWEHRADVAGRAPRGDAYPHEEARFGATSGHRLVEGDWKLSLKRLYFSPFVDSITFEVARMIVRREGLGRGEDPDLLAVSLSGTDTVGHFYGPESHEALDALLRLDAELGEFLVFLEEAVAPDGLAVVLTSDHGVSAIPEWLAETGRSQCPAPGGRVDLLALGEALQAELERAFGGSGANHGTWILFEEPRLTVNRKRAAASGVGVAEIAAVAKSFLGEQGAIERVWTAEEIAVGTGPEPFAALYRNSFDPQRSGDLSIQPARGCFISEHPAGTGHGTPYLYDRRVPLIFFGAGVSPAVVAGPAATVDIAPTLARLLGLSVPEGLDGRVLSLRWPQRLVSPRGREPSRS